MADLPFLTTCYLDGQLRAMIGDTYDPGFGPDAFKPWVDVTITPTLVGADSLEVRIVDQDPDLTVLLLPIAARIETGVLRIVRGPAPASETPSAAEYAAQQDAVGVPLIAETPALELPAGVHLAYKVVFSPFKIGGRPYTLAPFAFPAPTSGVRVDMSSVERITLPKSSSGTVTGGIDGGSPSGAGSGSIDGGTP